MNELKELLDRLERMKSQAEAAKARAEAHLQKIQHVIKSLKETEALLKAQDLETLTAGWNKYLAVESIAEIPAETQPERRRARSTVPPEEVAKIAREAILESGRPMKRGALVAVLEGRGVPLVGKDKNKNLGTILWRHGDKFVHLEKLGYWPRDVALPGVYDP